MRKILNGRKVFLIALIVWGSPAFRASASDEAVVAVISSHSAPYQQAWEGFQEDFGRSVPYTVLSDGEPKIPAGTRIIVAIGGQAALYPYPAGPLLIYCLAPGTMVSPDARAGALLKVHTSPSMEKILIKFKEMQPSLARLAVFWAGDSIRDYFQNAREIKAQFGIELISDRVRNPDELPDHLRNLKGKIDAIWLPPDAVMVTPKNFNTIKEFSLANRIPFYVPSEGLVERGAVASVTASFTEIGAVAGKMTRQALEGSLKTDRVFPETVHLTVNVTAAARSGLTLAPDVIKKADRIVQ